MPGSARTALPAQLVAAAMVSMMTWWLAAGRPRQFIERWDNSRCSILFHLKVPGGRWQTVISSPAWPGRAASPAFHTRLR